MTDPRDDIRDELRATPNGRAEIFYLIDALARRREVENRKRCEELVVTLLATLYLVIRCAPALLWGN